jgi:hypothetical protein
MTLRDFQKLRPAYVYAVGALVLGVVFGACGKDNSPDQAQLGPGPDPAACTHGVVVPDSVILGVLDPASACLLANAYANGTGPAVDSAYSQSYTLHAAPGMLYSVRMHFAPTGGKPDSSYRQQMSLFGAGATPGSELLLAASDYNATRDNILYFFAGAAGSYSLRASGGLPADTGSYTLTPTTCPIVDSVPATVAYTDSAGQLGPTDCQQPWSQLNGATGDSAHVRYYVVQFAANESRTVTVVSHAYTPTFEIGGPGLDGMYNVEQSNGTSGNAVAGDTITTATLYSGLYPGVYTLAVGGFHFADQGSYILTISAP